MHIYEVLVLTMEKQSKTIGDDKVPPKPTKLAVGIFYHSLHESVIYSFCKSFASL